MAARGRTVRVMIVDDSAVMRSLLRTVVVSDSGLEVVGTASDGVSALHSILNLRPDLVLLDVEMPVMDGLITLRTLRATGNRVPVIMCSALTQRGGRVTIEALASGASDCVAKPTGHADRAAATSALRQDLLPKIHALTDALVIPERQPALLFPVPARSPSPVSLESLPTPPRVLVIGVSTGGPAALDVLLPALPGNFPLPVLIVQHMPELFTRLLAERLNDRCSLQVREVAEGLPVRAGTIVIARGDWHMEVHAGSVAAALPTLHLSQGPQENHCRPAADVLFRTAAAVYGAAALALVLTGMGSDGLAGCRILRNLGATVLAQDQATSAVWGMPGAVAGAGLAQRVLPLRAIAPEILRIVARTSSEARGLREATV